MIEPMEKESFEPMLEVGDITGELLCFGTTASVRPPLRLSERAIVKRQSDQIGEPPQRCASVAPLNERNQADDAAAIPGYEIVPTCLHGAPFVLIQ